METRLVYEPHVTAVYRGDVMLGFWYYRHIPPYDPEAYVPGVGCKTFPSEKDARAWIESAAIPAA